MESAVSPLSMVRNIGIIAHIDAGKTSVTERFLYYTGKTHRIGDIDCGNTVMDYLDEERKRGITITSAAASFEWQPHGRKKHLIHLIDTPGHIDFTAEVERSLRICDGVIVVFSGVEGVEAQSEKVWRQSIRYRLPKIAFVNKLDRIGASFASTVADIRRKFPDVAAIPLQLPLGEESGLVGMIDLIAMRAVFFHGEEGDKVEFGPIPEAYCAAATNAREAMVAAVAELSPPVAEYYLDNQPIPESLLLAELRNLTVDGKICPVLGGSAKKNIGMQPLLDAITYFLPSPPDRPPVAAIRPETEEPVHIAIDDPNFYGLAFKLLAGESADLIYVRTYAGKLRVNDTVYNPRTREKVKIKRILRLFAKNVEAIDEAGPGDIIGVIGPHLVSTGDTLCAVNKPMLLEKIMFPEPVISLALEPRSSRDKDRLADCLQLLCREDPTLELSRNESGQLLLSGMGELHLEINTNRLKQEFKLDVRFGKPRVAFRETMVRTTRVTGCFARTLGDNKELFAEIDIEFIPETMDAGIVVENRVTPNALIPRAWINSAETTLNNALKTGGNHGYPMIHVRAIVKALRGMPEKTTEGAIGGAVMAAVNQAILQGTQVLEPLMRLNIIVPEEHLGEVTGYLQARRAVILQINALYGNEHLVCEVPLAEMFGFSKALPQLSGGRAGFSMEPCGYQPISSADLQRLIDSSAAM